MDDRDSIHDLESETAPTAESESLAQPKKPRPNESLRLTLARIALIHARMGYTSGDRTQEYIREARDGGMYGDSQ